ncbi:MAG: UDP-N-acetylenolpyruvoylglucosamine reductase [Rickettsiaceae bacterium]|jgi:UDP-N-acetylmuramate dehydrogenase|nr:UDP-N-acetylenolpyruvoylglucosamine reductase [Rickettsiaceae bacterium]
MSQIFVKELPNIEGEYRFNADLTKTNWFNVGGPADILLRPKDTADLANFLVNKPFNLPITTLGVGSNIIIRDGGIEGVVIKLGRGFNYTEIIEPGKIKVGAAVLNFNFVQFCLTNSITGFEFMVGIPGTIGGGIAMNAGAYGAEFKDFIDYIIAIDESGNIHKISNRDIGFVYRGNTLPEGMVFVEAVFNFELGKKQEIKDKIDFIIETRNASQPVREKTGGSTFANPTGYKAWQLIDEAGCRGERINDAQISDLHCNFMINLGNATAKDLENLGEHVRKKVFVKSGVQLEWEIKRIGRYA